MPAEVKRSYRSVRRAEQAAATQLSVLRAAREHFTSVGYAATTVADISRAAGVNTDTVYRVVGRKPQLLLAVIDMELAGSDRPVEAEQRDYVRAILAAHGARLKLTTYADALGRVMPRVAPLFDALAQAAVTEPGCAAVRDEIGARRRAHMLTMALDLRATGDLRDDLDDDEVADLLWTTNAPEYYALAVARGWSPATYAERLGDLWTRLLLADPRVASTPGAPVVDSPACEEVRAGIDAFNLGDFGSTVEHFEAAVPLAADDDGSDDPGTDV